MSFYVFARSVAAFVTSLLFKITIVGKEHVPKEKGFILCSNHISDFDPIFVCGWIKPRCAFMAKEELFRLPPMRALFRAVGAFPVARGKGDTSAVEHAIRIVKDGGAVTIFPEGTRSRTGELLKLKSGAVLIASQSGGDILPCVVKMGKRQFVRKPVTVRFGNLIANESLGITGKSPSEIKAANRLLTTTLTTLLEEIHV